MRIFASAPFLFFEAANILDSDKSGTYPTFVRQLNDFDALWRAYPTNWEAPVLQPCSDYDGKPHWKHQCAIRLSVALHQLDVDFSKSRLKTCAAHGWEHILRANELRLFLERNPTIAGPVDPLGADVKSEDLRGFRGIIFCGDFWGPYQTRDHIDLWNGERMGSSPSSEFTDFINRSNDTRFWIFR